MDILLDTHAFLWWVDETEKLSTTVYDAIGKVENDLFLSDASIWEMQIKHQIGRLSFRLPLSELVAVQRNKNNIKILPISTGHILNLSTPPLHHRDPFDRLLISQANVEGLTLATRDTAFSQYTVRTIW